MASPTPKNDEPAPVPVPVPVPAVQQHQTRYQFYDADSPEMVESASKSREMVMTLASSSSSGSGGGAGCSGGGSGGGTSNTGSDEENNAAGCNSNELKAIDIDRNIERDNDNSLVKVPVPAPVPVDKYLISEYEAHADADAEPAVESDPNNTSDVEDILRNLAETESEVISSKKSNGSAVSGSGSGSGSGSSSAISMGRPPMHDRNVSNATAATAMTISSPNTKDADEYESDDDNNDDDDDDEDEEVTAITSPSKAESRPKGSTTTTTHEQLIREAIQHIRRRALSREKFLAATHNISNATNNTKSNSNTDNNMSNNMPEQPLPLIIPTSVDCDICNATKLDNRLLSPPADVRKAASDMDMFRHQSCTPNASSTSDGLNLAQPVFSAGSGMGMGIANTNTNTSTNNNDGVESPMHRLDFSVVPSSPAPGKFGHQYGNNHNNQHQSHSSNNNNNTQSSQSQSQSHPQSHKKQVSNDISRQVQLERERNARREMEIEKGVEQVLVAILQKANGTGTGNGNGIDVEQLLGGMFQDERKREKDNNNNNIDKATVKNTSAVDELLQADSTEDDEVINELSAAFQPVTLSEPKHEQEESIDIDINIDIIDEPQDQEEVVRPGTRSGKKRTKTSIRPLSNSIDGLLEVEAVQREESEHEVDAGRSFSGSENSRSRSENSHSGDILIAEGSTSSEEDVVEHDDLEMDIKEMEEMVLGPLSKRGTTGVVLQHDDDDDVEDTHNDDDDEDLATSSPQKDPTSPSIMSSVVTSAARRTTNILSKLSFGSSPASAKSQDDSIVMSTAPAKSEKQSEEEFVRDLYSHMMIRHSSYKSSKKDASSSSIVALDKKEEFTAWMSDHLVGTTNLSTRNYKWDDEDLDEPGYITHTVTRSKLHQMESEFEGMIEEYEAEFVLEMRKQTPSSAKRKARSSANTNGGNGNDFENDLDQVEKMLAAKKGKLKKKMTSPAKKRKGTDAIEKLDSATKSSSLEHNDALATNSLFPGTKAAGEGEVGDLEIYHLPIIYKAHQTGFEPTKDLVLQPDSVFARQYYVQSELGSAAFSTAYRCVDLTSGKKAEDEEIYYDEVCLKVIKNTKDFFDQSLDEIKILELLRQTGECNENNILEMKAFFYHKEHLIIVTELLRQNLFEFGKYITEHDEPVYFTRSRLCYIARQCLVALSFVHKLGLVHSDIKPENILLSSYSRARVKVIDFGSSCYLTDRQSSYIQSRSYRAPEVVLGLAYDGKIDVWSLGCVIAEMYTGQVTFQNDSVVTMLSRIEAICGAFPRNMIEDGRQSGQFFSPTGLLYEKVENDDDSCVRMDTSNSFVDDDSAAAENSMFNIFQPKTTTMGERLGFDPDLMERKRKTWEEEDSCLFVDFITKLLTIDPEKRPSAEEALEHPWILAGFNLSEDDLKYPPE